MAIGLQQLKKSTYLVLKELNSGVDKVRQVLDIQESKQEASGALTSVEHAQRVESCQQVLEKIQLVAGEINQLAAQLPSVQHSTFLSTAAGAQAASSDSAKRCAPATGDDATPTQPKL